MSDLPWFRIFWRDALYTPVLQEKIDTLFAEDPTLLSVVGRRSSVPRGSNDFKTISDLRGCERLTETPQRAWLDKCPSPLLNGTSLSDHLYEPYLWYAGDARQEWLVMMHREIVLVLPGKAQDRRDISKIETNSMAFLQKPVSAHEKLMLPTRLTRIAKEASGLLSFIWDGGITLGDTHSVMPQARVDLTPGPSLQPVLFY